jgi:hypothetical protein
MINPDWNPEPEITLHVDLGIIFYEDEEEEDPIALFYHKADDPEGCALEAKRRREIMSYIKEGEKLESLEKPREIVEGDSLKDNVVPVANTTNVVGVLKGDVEFSPTYKRLSEITREDAELNLGFLENWLTVEQDELALLKVYDIEKGWDDWTPVE